MFLAAGGPVVLRYYYAPDFISYAFTWFAI
jgi:hypothetical protein